MNTIRTRFAPSPTGFVHIGSLRTALFAFLFARKNQGHIILRVEDTDQNRKVEGAVENLLKVMKTVGVEFDEGFFLNDAGLAEQKGEFGPYLQSQRLDLYHEHIAKLVEEKKAYYCFCSEQRLEDLRKEQTALKKPPMYDGHCRRLSQDEIDKQMAEFKAAGKNPVVRFAIPTSGQTIIEDLIYGKIVYENQLLDDQVLLKSDGFPTYHLAVVIDDHFMQISHVIRGEEWIPSTPKHILLYQAFGWEAPKFAHLPLTLNPDKSKLSKRQGDVAVEDFLAKGYLPEALINFVAFLGWNPKTEQEIFSLEELINQFDLNKINKSAPIFDVGKLDWMNSVYIKTKSDVELVELLKPYWEKAGVEINKFSNEFLQAVTALEKERLKKLSEIGERTGYYFAAPAVDPKLLVWKKSTSEDAKSKLNELAEFFENLPEEKFSRENLETEVKNFIAAKNYDNGSTLWPMRVALTGLEKSPGPFDAAAVLFIGYGKQEIVKRLKSAAASII
ncbi:MAG: glutamate--tRNA ligase [Candidatus Doudnabacteria bacterium]|nr:glutamate--tRNA ligase [Candidatus Doudnabacteria bacterium]